MIRSTILTCLVVVLLTVSQASAEIWQPPEPDNTAWDWIRMTSGEWLGGTLEGLRDRDIEFDSDELGLLKLDWMDVAELRSPRILTYRFDDLGTYTGTAVMHGDTVTIRTDAGVQRLPRAELLLILEGSGRELDYWSAKISAGLVARSGNTNQSDLNSTLRVRRLTPGSRGTLNYAGNYGKVEDVETIDNHNLTAGLDILITGGFFVNPLTINLFRDPFQNIDLKSTIAAGVGYVILRDGPVNWTVGLSGGYQTTGHVSVEPGVDSRVENGTIIGYTEVEWDITGDIDCLFDYNAQVGIPDASQAFHHARASLSFDILGDILELDLAVIWDRIESPQRDAEGNVPERDDFRSTFGVGLDF
jgi:hypothetical protein